jgi:CheY-like chemotaxis protein
MPEIRILAVDDEPVIGVSIKFALARVGYSVEVATNAEEALKRFADGKYDVVITDLQMPRITGLELAERLKAQSPSVKIMLLSGSPPFPSTPAIDLAMLKPFSVQELRDAIANLAGDRLQPSGTR